MKMKRELLVLGVIIASSLLLVNGIRLDYFVLPEDYPFFLYGLVGEIIREDKFCYYTLPYHYDSWDHITIAKEIVKKEGIIWYNPYLGEKFSDRNWEINYGILLAEISILTGIDPLYLAAIVPTIIGIILALNTFILVRYLTGSDLAGIFSSIFVLTIKSSWTLMGIWFLVPVAYGMSQIPLIVFLFLRVIKSNARVGVWDVTLALVFINVTLSHPPSTIIFLPVFLLYLILNPELVVKNKEKISVAIVVLFILSLRFIPIDSLDYGGVTSSISRMLKTMTFRDEPPPGTDFYYDSFLGPIIIALVVVGGICSLKSKEMRILPIAFISLTPFIVQFYLTNELFLSPFRRLFMYTSEIALIIAGVGLFYSYTFLMGRVREGGGRVRKALRLIFITAVILIMVIQIDSTFHYRNNIFRVIFEEDVDSIEWLRNTPEDSLILADPAYSKVITPIAGRRVISLARARLGAGDRINKKAIMFFDEGCEVKEEIIKEFGADYVFTFTGRINCKFLNEVYSDSKSGNRIYRYDPSG